MTTQRDELNHLPRSVNGLPGPTGFVHPEAGPDAPCHRSVTPRIGGRSERVRSFPGALPIVALQDTSA